MKIVFDTESRPFFKIEGVNSYLYCYKECFAFRIKTKAFLIYYSWEYFKQPTIQITSRKTKKKILNII